MARYDDDFWDRWDDGEYDYDHYYYDNNDDRDYDNYLDRDPGPACEDW